MFVRKLKRRLDSMTPAAFWILRLSFYLTYFCFALALFWALKVYLAPANTIVRGAATAIRELVRLPQAVLLVGVLGSAIAEDIAQR